MESDRAGESRSTDLGRTMGASKKSTKKKKPVRTGSQSNTGKDAVPDAADGLEKSLRSMLGSAERETSAIEALDKHFETGDEEALGRAQDLLKESLEHLKEAQRDIDELLAACLISYEYWKAITDEIRGARKYDTRAAIQIDDEYEGILEPRDWLRIAIGYKDIGIAMLKNLRSQAVRRA